MSKIGIILFTAPCGISIVVGAHIFGIFKQMICDFLGTEKKIGDELEVVKLGKLVGCLTFFRDQIIRNSAPSTRMISPRTFQTRNPLK